MYTFTYTACMHKQQWKNTCKDQWKDTKVTYYIYTYVHIYRFTYAYILYVFSNTF